MFVRLLCLHKKLFNFEIKNVVKFHVYIRPIFSCRVTYIQLYILGLETVTVALEAAVLQLETEPSVWAHQLVGAGAGAVLAGTPARLTNLDCLSN